MKIHCRRKCGKFVAEKGLLCPNCQELNLPKRPQPRKNFGTIKEDACLICQGVGFIADEVCKKCDGWGLKEVPLKEIEVQTRNQYLKSKQVT